MIHLAVWRVDQVFVAEPGSCQASTLTGTREGEKGEREVTMQWSESDHLTKWIRSIECDLNIGRGTEQAQWGIGIVKKGKPACFCEIVGACLSKADKEEAKELEVMPNALSPHSYPILSHKVMTDTEYKIQKHDTCILQKTSSISPPYPSFNCIVVFSAGWRWTMNQCFLATRVTASPRQVASQSQTSTISIIR